MRNLTARRLRAQQLSGPPARDPVITWLNRGTLHLVTSEDYPWLHAELGSGDGDALARDGEAVLAFLGLAGVNSAPQP